MGFRCALRLELQPPSLHSVVASAPLNLLQFLSLYIQIIGRVLLLELDWWCSVEQALA